MGRLSRSGAPVHEFGIFEDRTSDSGQHPSIDAPSATSHGQFALLENRNTNSGRSTPDFIDSLTTKLKALHIYSPKKNRGDKSLLPPVRGRLTRSATDTKIIPVLDYIREEAEDCDERSTVTSRTQGPFPAELLQETKRDEDIPSSTETPAPAAASPRQTPASFEAHESSFSSQGLLV